MIAILYGFIGIALLWFTISKCEGVTLSEIEEYDNNLK